MAFLTVVGYCGTNNYSSRHFYNSNTVRSRLVKVTKVKREIVTKLDPTQIYFLSEKPPVKIALSETERLIRDSREIREALWDQLEQEIEMIDTYKKNNWKYKD